MNCTKMPTSSTSLQIRRAYSFVREEMSEEAKQRYTHFLLFSTKGTIVLIFFLS